MPQDVPKQQGYERYEWRHYLWHLIAVGAIRPKPPAPDPDDGKYEIEAAAWCDAPGAVDGAPGAGEIVALIDTGVNPLHPNLAPETPAGPRILPGADFAAHPYGLTHVEDAQPAPALAALNAANVVEATPRKTRGLERPLAASLVSDAVRDDALALFAAGSAEAALVARLAAGRGVRHAATRRDRLSYASHGTACAGLIAGAPPAPAPVDADPDDASDRPLPHWGVAPGARVLPITVSAQPTAEQLILAFLHALSFADADGRGVSVIHFPREAPDPVRAHRFRKGFDDTRYGGAEATTAWDAFHAVFAMVAARVPVICAAGNEGYAHLSYPASEARGGNGVVAVGAISFQGRRSGYSNYADGSGPETLTIAAPSDDAEVYTRRQIRLDRESPRWRDHNFLLHLQGPDAVPEVPYAAEGVLAPDVPGSRGYASGALQGSEPSLALDRDRSALYALFGGTSAASAIVAGAVALRQAKARAETGQPLHGPAMKAALAAAGATQTPWPWLAANTALVVDAPNGEDLADPTLPARQFGAGALDLAQLLA
jgi:subtilisin family serine protease